MERAECLFRHGTSGRRDEPGPAGRAARLPGLTALLSVLCLSLGAAEARASDVGAGPLAGLDAVAIHDIQAGHVPGAVVVVGEHGRTVYEKAFGQRALEPQPEPQKTDDIFDLASLTKVVGTTTAVMQLVESGRIDLQAPAARYWPAFAANGKAQITVRQLLTHTSGLQADLDPSGWSGREGGLAKTAAMRPMAPAGTKFRYSDVNFVVLGALVERVSGEPLETYVREHIFAPLNMTDTGYLPPASALPRIAATDREDGELRWGQVQDPTAYRMGGVAGNAGLFSTARDLSRFAQMLLNGGELDGVRILRPETVELMTRQQAVPGGAERGLGWDMSSAYSQGLDAAFGTGSYGHTGYTGCLIWLDPATRSYLIILTSRLHPDGKGDVKPLRQDVGKLVAAFTRSRTASLAALAPAG